MPELVTGEPETVKMEGSDKPTDVTVPDGIDKVAYSNAVPAELTLKTCKALPNAVNPVPPKATPKNPDPILEASKEGTSLAAIFLNVGTAAAPLIGPAKNKFADCVVKFAVNVPDDVTGEPDTLNIAGKDSPTDVTVPDGMVSVAYSKAVPALFTLNTCKAVPSAVSPVPPLAIAKNPVVIFAASKFGISLATKALNVGAAATPDDGPANTLFATCVANVAVRVPELVTGEPETVKMEGSDKATDVTVPDVKVNVTYSRPDPAELTFKYWFAAPLFNTVQVVPSKYNRSPTAPLGKEKDPILGFLISKLFLG